jgi:hypothetical protein
MTLPTRTALGASTLNRDYYMDVDTGTTESPTWTPVMGIMEFQLNLEPDLQDDSDFDGGGFQSQTKTAEAWSAVTKIARKTTLADPTAYDAGQEFIRGKAIGKMGSANQVHVRIYEMGDDGPREEAWEGYAAAGWSPDGGAMDALRTVSVTLTGQGELKPITHPDDGS